MQQDAVALDIIWNRLISICSEAEAGLQRTAFSVAVREAHDFSCCLFDPNGNSIAQGTVGNITFLTTAPMTAQNILKKHPLETLERGDILVNNLSWEGAGHLNDVFVMAPIFHKGKLVALAGSVAHWPDIGGRGLVADARSVYEEGLQFPSIKIAQRGQFNEEVMALIRQNVRFTDDVIGDFTSQLIALDLMQNKLTELIETQGIEDFGEVAKAVLSRSEAAMRSAIAEVSDGDYENEVHMDGSGQSLIMKVKVSVRGTDIHVDYAGSSPQTEWAINSTPTFTYCYTFIAIKAILTPFLPNNSGGMPAVTLSMPAGSIVNPRIPCAAGLRHIIGLYCVPAVLGALGKAIPERVPAESQPIWANAFFGMGDNNRPFYSVPHTPCGVGALPNGDGMTCAMWPSSVRNTPIEVMEYSTQVLHWDKKQIWADSGGAGRYRGGCGEEIDIRVMGNEATAVCQSSVGTVHYAARGLVGGHPGATGIISFNGVPIDDKPALAIHVKSGDLVSLRTPGAGGHGDPLEREPERAWEDVVAGLVSPEQAAASYGVVIDGKTKKLDLGATIALRRSRGLVASGASR